MICSQWNKSGLIKCNSSVWYYDSWRVISYLILACFGDLRRLSEQLSRQLCPLQRDLGHLIPIISTGLKLSKTISVRMKLPDPGQILRKSLLYWPSLPTSGLDPLIRLGDHLPRNANQTIGSPLLPLYACLGHNSIKANIWCHSLCLYITLKCLSCIHRPSVASYLHRNDTFWETVLSKWANAWVACKWLVCYSVPFHVVDREEIPIRTQSA